MGSLFLLRQLKSSHVTKYAPVTSSSSFENSSQKSVIDDDEGGWNDDEITINVSERSEPFNCVTITSNVSNDSKGVSGHRCRSVRCNTAKPRPNLMWFQSSWVSYFCVRDAQRSPEEANSSLAYLAPICQPVLQFLTRPQRILSLRIIVLFITLILLITQQAWIIPIFTALRNEKNKTEWSRFRTFVGPVGVRGICSVRLVRSLFYKWWLSKDFSLIVAGEIPQAMNAMIIFLTGNK